MRARDVRTLWRWTVPVALALLAVFVFVVWSVVFVARGPLSAGEGEPRGRYAIECRHPRGALAQYTAFEARGGKPAGGWFHFQVFDAAAPGTPLLDADHLGETKWIPPAAELAKLPARIRWRIAAVDEHGVELDADEAEAWISGGR